MDVLRGRSCDTGSMFRIIGITCTQCPWRQQPSWSTDLYVLMPYILKYFLDVSISDSISDMCVATHSVCLRHLQKTPLKTYHNMVTEDLAHGFIQGTAAYTTWKCALGPTLQHWSFSDMRLKLSYLNSYFYCEYIFLSLVTATYVG